MMPYEPDEPTDVPEYGLYRQDASDLDETFPDWLYTDEEEPDEDFCSHCGKNFYDFSDLGCGFCDRRSPDWGLVG